MGYYAAASPNLFGSTAFQDCYGGRRFNVIDGGSRSTFFEPLNAVPDRWNIFAFDADLDAPLYQTAGVTRIPYGIWSETKTAQLHLAVEPSTSSIYPPDLELFELLCGPEMGAKYRRTARMVDVPCISIDDAVSRDLIPPPNILKLDIHSSEYEAIAGAKNSISQCICVLTETWTHQFHKGQKCHGHIEALLNDMGFFLYDIAPVYGYNQSSVYGTKLPGDRKILTMTESIFFRSEVNDPDLAMLHVALLDLFRYTNLASHKTDSYCKRGAIAPDLAERTKALLHSYPRQRNFSWRHPQFYRRWLRNIARAAFFPDRDVVYSGR